MGCFSFLVASGTPGATSPIWCWGIGAVGGAAHGRRHDPGLRRPCLYNVWLLPFVRFDHLVHAIGFGFAGMAFWESVRHTVDRAVASGAAMTMMGGLGFGALNEMVEFLITSVVPDTNIGEFENTGWDLVANTVGAAFAAIWVRRRWAQDESRRASIATSLMTSTPAEAR